MSIGLDVLTLLHDFLDSGFWHFDIFKLIINLFDFLFIKSSDQKIFNMANKLLAEINSHSLSAAPPLVLLDFSNTLAPYHDGTWSVGARFVSKPGPTTFVKNEVQDSILAKSKILGLPRLDNLNGVGGNLIKTKR